MMSTRIVSEVNLSLDPPNKNSVYPLSPITTSVLQSWEPFMGTALHHWVSGNLFHRKRKPTCPSVKVNVSCPVVSSSL